MAKEIGKLLFSSCNSDTEITKAAEHLCVSRQYMQKEHQLCRSAYHSSIMVTLQSLLWAHAGDLKALHWMLATNAVTQPGVLKLLAACAAASGIFSRPTDTENEPLRQALLLVGLSRASLLAACATVLQEQLS